MIRPSHLTPTTPEAPRFLTDGSSALAVDFLPPEPPDEEKTPHLSLVPTLPENAVKLAHETDSEQEAQTRYANWLSTLAVADTVQVQEIAVAPPKTNLLEQIQRAREGDEQALRSVALNVKTATGEGWFKVDHFPEEIEMTRGEDGHLIQFGQSLESVHANAILLRPDRPGGSKAITDAEALNGQRIQVKSERGQLSNVWFAVPSIVRTDGRENELDHRGDGYFTETMSFTWQVTTETPDGKIVTESVFMAGVEPGYETFEERMANRFDIAAIGKVYEHFGFEAPKTAEEFIKNPLIIPKDVLESGLLDLMMLTDQATDEVLGRQVERKLEDYVALRDESRRKQASVAAAEKRVLEDLLAADLNTPMEAVKLMWELVKEHGVKDAMTNDAINPIVFGQKAAPMIEKARHYYLQGDLLLAQQLTQQAEKYAVISGCGGGSGGGGGSWLYEQMMKQIRQLTGQLNEAELIERFGQDKDGVPLAFYCEDCGWLNDRSDPRRRRADGSFIYKLKCDGCDKITSCGDPDAF